MPFLCTRHRHALLQLPPARLTATWRGWLDNAGLYYGLGQWQQAIPYLGCAFDLSCHTLHRQAPEMAARQLGLSALYFANACRHADEHIRADAALTLAARLLQALASPGCSEALQVLREPGRQAAFFARHLNLPWSNPPAPTLH